MKKNILLTVILALCATFAALAGPAFPGKITYTQPDGSTIDIWLHGDEFGHWATDASGNILQQDEEGYWRIASNRSGLESLKQRAKARRQEVSQQRRNAAATRSNNFGSPRIPVILIGFQKKEFTKTNEEFDAMLNLPGYSENKAIGSVWDYYNENSFGAFTPQFEVIGPVTVPHEESYYGANSGDNDVLPEMALVHAARILDDDVDFSRYDNDGDGMVDFVVYYFAGYDEAQGGASTCIWSHAWNVTASSVARDSCTFDGVKLDSYFCTAELKGASGSTMCSIGTTCHEFAHTLGLPDFYDTDYSYNGNAANMYDFDLMANGAYNSDSTKPPYFTAEELMEIGWLAEIPELMSDGSYTMQAINYPDATEYSAFMTKTSVENEYFVYEVRGGKRWDSGIGYSGLLVYHVDRSNTKIYGSYTAADMWYYNGVNMFSSHPCCYVVPAAKPTQTSIYYGSKYLFGVNGYTKYSPTDWSGASTNFSFTNISYSNGTATFNFTNSNPKGVQGTIINADGNPVSGVTVTAIPGDGVQSAPGAGKSIRNFVRMLLNPTGKNLRAAKAQSWTVTSGADGSYYIEGLPSGNIQVTATKTGYTPSTVIVEVTSRMTTKDIRLLRKGQDGPMTIYAWPNDLLTDEDEDIVGSDTRSLTAQNLYPASELSQYSGKQLKELTFYVYGTGYTSYKDVHVIIDYGNDRVATVPVNSSDLVQGGYTTVDLRSLDLLVPEGKDVYAGVGFSRGGYHQSGYYYSFGCFYKSDEQGRPYDWAGAWPYDGLVSSFSTTSTGERESWDLIFDFRLTLCDHEAPDMGYNYIADPGNGSYKAGDVFDLILIETSGNRRPASTTDWYFDGEQVSTESVTLTKGTHTVEARFTTAAGKTKIVELELSVN